jgi:hypothetical protein
MGPIDGRNFRGCDETDPVFVRAVPRGRPAVRPTGTKTAAAQARRWRAANPEAQAAIDERARAGRADERRRLRLETFQAYSEAVPSCACCGESTIEFLTLDHIDGGGNADRKANKHSGGTTTYRRLRRSGYPPGYRVLCWNCNAATGLYGECPHST